MLISHRIYEALWRKDRAGLAAPDVYLPQTILFEGGQPLQWFFSSTTSETILRKNRINVNIPNLIKIFKNFRSKPHEICAVAICLKAMPDLSPSIDVVHMVHAQVVSFLENASSTRFTGLVQEFVRPPTYYNSMLRVKWSPEITSIEQRVNVNDLARARLLPERRAATFFGPSTQTRYLPPAGEHFLRRIHTVAGNIVRHAELVGTFPFGMKPVRAIMFMKMASRSRVAFLFCTSFQLAERPERAPALRAISFADPLASPSLERTPSQTQLASPPRARASETRLRREDLDTPPNAGASAPSTGETQRPRLARTSAKQKYVELDAELWDGWRGYVTECMSNESVMLAPPVAPYRFISGRFDAAAESLQSADFDESLSAEKEASAPQRGRKTSKAPRKLTVTRISSHTQRLALGRVDDSQPRHQEKDSIARRHTKVRCKTAELREDDIKDLAGGTLTLSGVAGTPVQVDWKK
eukprot:gnl/Chilomastix_cuspidata/3367.p1 GENE.gnl/Chilomastix_cuspidata/3367~~gnl/Chilomastix_cuspidata/3367.p1  ORF type:complete len:478 (-),score=196.43 gnl/Chilomastix_cuspidata/3367:50-1459(-)